MSEYRPCPICSSKSIKLLEKATGIPPSSANQIQVTDKFFGSHGDLVRCNNCGFTYIGRMDYIKKVIGLYKKMSDEIYLQEEKERRLSFLEIIKNIEMLKKGKRGNILDIGCCTGGLLVEAQKRGWEVSGIDPSQWACKCAKRYHGLKVVNSLIESFNPSMKFDAITMLDVLEHVENPRKIIKKAKSMLKKDGVFCIVTPDYGSFTSRLLGKKWWGIRLAHLSYFRENDIKRLIWNNFNILKSNTYVRYFSLYYILIRLFPFIGKFKVIKTILRRITVPIALFDTFEIYLGKSS